MFHERVWIGLLYRNLAQMQPLEWPRRTPPRMPKVGEKTDSVESIVRRLRSPPQKAGGGFPPNGAAESALSSSALWFEQPLHQAISISERQLSSARPAPPPNQRMNPSLLFENRPMLCGRENHKHSIIRTLDPQRGLSAAPLGCLVRHLSETFRRKEK